MMDNQESGLHKAVTFLGKVLGLAAAIMLTPNAFNATGPSIHAHLRSMWGEDAATWLTWAMGGLEGLAIYGVVWMIFTTVMLYLFAAWAARRFSGT